MPMLTVTRCDIGSPRAKAGIEAACRLGICQGCGDICRQVRRDLF
jgi:hypothetical protein